MHLPWVFVGLLAWAQMVCAAMFSSSSPVVTADVNSFDSEVLSLSKPTFVAFTAPWCGHCKSLAPEYDRASRSMDGIVKFVNVDCDEQRNAAVCQKYGVKGFPTIKMFPPTKKRVPKDYRGERTAKALTEYAASELPLTNVQKMSASQLGSYVSNDQGKVLLFTSKPSSTPLYKSLALDFKGALTFATARSDNEEVVQAALEALNLDVSASAPKLLYIPPNDAGAFKVYDGQLKFKKLYAWLQEVSPEATKAAKSKSKSKSSTKSKKSKGKSSSKKASHSDL